MFELYIKRGMLEFMIPKMIHYCWLGGNEIPETIKSYIKSWQNLCPEYKIIQWNEKNFDVNQNVFCQEAFKAKKWAFVSDFMRLKVLYDYGGIYLDTDVEMVKPLDSLLKYDAFCGYEKNPMTIQSAIIGVVPHHKWIKLLLEDYNNKKFIVANGEMDLTPNVKRISKLTQEKYRIKLDGRLKIFGNNMILLPFDYLCANDYFSGVVKKTKNTYAIHHYRGSWKSERRQREKSINLYLIKHFGPKWGKYLWYIYWYIFVHKRDKFIHVFYKHILRKNINEDQL